MDQPIISIEDHIREVFPAIRLGCMLVQVTVQSSALELTNFIQQEISTVQVNLDTEKIHLIKSLSHTREAYKMLGKDPSRYRPSAEALLRRVVKGKGLYQVNNVVDTLNLISIQSGFSIGGYDAEKISGKISLGIGKKNEPYEAIGRGELNVHCLPVLRDATGAFGSPTSDTVRTMVTDLTTKFLIVFFDFGDEKERLGAMDKLQGWLAAYAAGITIGKWRVG